MIDHIVLQSWLDRTTLIQELLHASSLPKASVRRISDLLFEVEAEIDQEREELQVAK